MNVDIYIREAEGKSGREIRIPWLPEHINVDTGEASMVSYEILNLGEVAKPTGVGLSGYSWESIFPGIFRTDTSMLRGEAQDPSQYDSILKYWKNNKKKLHLFVTGYPINDDVYLTSYSSKASGGFGDLEYAVSFKEAREITVKSSKSTTQNAAPTKRSTASDTSKTYEVKIGDTLWSIAQAKLGSGMNWYTIYKKNMVVIEETAKKRGKLSSQNGHWIYPGTILILP